MARDIEEAFPVLVIIFCAIVILGCVSTTIGPAQNNTTANSTSTFPGISANVSIDEGNYNASYGLSVDEKLGSIKLALGAGQFLENSRGCTNISVGEVIPSNTYIKPVWLDSGFMNTDKDIVSVPIDTRGNIISGIPYFGVIFVVYVDISNSTVAGVDTFDIRSQYDFIAADIPGNSCWYHQLAGSSRMSHEYTTTRMSFSIVTDDNDTNSIYPILLDTENFQKFRNGSRYEALQYTDYMTNRSCLIDGKMPLTPQYIDNGTAAWYAYVSASSRASTDVDYFKPKDYYVVIQNKENRTIPVKLNVYMAIP